jgi:hypothetical protein
MKLNELMSEHPLDVNTRLHVLAIAFLPLHSPVADKIIEKRVLKRRRRLRCGELEEKEEHEKER